MKRIVILFALVALFGCETIEPSRIVVNLNPKLRTFPITRVAILAFEAQPVNKETEEYYGWWKFNIMNNGEVISDLFMTEMMALPTFQYLERSQIRRILQEKNISMTDLIRDKTASEIGELLGADAVILGKVNQLFAGVGAWGNRNCRIAFSVRMVDTKTGTVLWSATVDRFVDGHPETLKIAQEECAKIVKELRSALEPEVAKPAQQMTSPR